MKAQFIADIIREMLPVLDNQELQYLKEVLEHNLWHKEIHSVKKSEPPLVNNEELLDMFLAAKRVEGCSERTITYYRSILIKALQDIKLQAYHIKTEELREYLVDYQELHKCSRCSLDNIRRVLSSFFSWLEEENLILKSPMRRIHKIRKEKNVKTTYSDEDLELLRNNCHHIRDLAMIDLLASTGIRVGELVRLNRVDIDFERRECIVLGKGCKERLVYFDARTKLHLKQYLERRNDANPALFVSKQAPHPRLKISGVELFFRKLGRQCGLTKVHPHKFRRTLATMAIDKGMPIEQVQCLLGHNKIDTTLEYAMVNQSNVKISHKRFIA